MSMISELVKELRKYAKGFKNSSYGREIVGIEKLLVQAADTIEELSAKVARQNMERSSQYYGENKKVFEIRDEVLVRGTISMKSGSNYFVDMQGCGIWEAEENIIPLPTVCETKEN